MTQTYKLKNHFKPAQAALLKTKFLDDTSYDLVIDHDADGYDNHGNLLFRFRKGIIPLDIITLGYNAFKDSIIVTESRGAAAGGATERLRSDGSKSNFRVAPAVQSGSVGFMDQNARIKYCRKTAFARDYFEKFSAGIPFVEHVDKMYKELCPNHYSRQIAISKGTNRNYRIADTSFTTVTVNRNFQTAVHKDSGDFPEGFGNLCVYREGHYEGAYFVLPEYRVAIDMRTQDLLFVDVHRWHGNTPFKNMSEDYMRVAFVMYYRELMYKCGSPKQELSRVQKDWGGFLNI